MAGDLVGAPEALVVDSTPLSVLHPRQVEQSFGGWGRPASGAARARWGSFAVYGVKPHLLCSTSRVPVSYELTAANVADVLLVTEQLKDDGEHGTIFTMFVTGSTSYR